MVENGDHARPGMCLFALWRGPGMRGSGEGLLTHVSGLLKWHRCQAARGHLNWSFTLGASPAFLLASVLLSCLGGAAGVRAAGNGLRRWGHAAARAAHPQSRVDRIAACAAASACGSEPAALAGWADPSWRR